MSDAIPLQDRLAWSIKEYCQLAGISVALYFKLQKAGKGPDTKKIAGRTLIPRDAGLRWLGQSAA